jgi:hypothetical protein
MRLDSAHKFLTCYQNRPDYCATDELGTSGLDEVGHPAYG